jgi:hypothetical protein
MGHIVNCRLQIAPQSARRVVEEGFWYKPSALLCVLCGRYIRLRPPYCPVRSVISLVSSGTSSLASPTTP